MDKEELAQDILEFLGNRENVEENTTCMTRLRVKVSDFSKVNVSELKKVDGVLGVVCNGNLVQIVLGAGKVDRIGKNFSELTKLSLNESRSNDNKKVDIKNEDIKKY
ncbi:PTS transporter subunit EIIB [Leptotrichia sp. oral taxon 498]|uniref:PTS transporter subunit EIIB n=1 Tax=Leptotrichia sp. oral taxon 498 TaxID=712368 RepID=UPI001C12C4F8|nr:PTS glucose/sucrose transporter subunit IIB [Leptotrichia sp. oral taxon 498]